MTTVLGKELPGALVAMYQRGLWANKIAGATLRKKYEISDEAEELYFMWTDGMCEEIKHLSTLASKQPEIVADVYAMRSIDHEGSPILLPYLDIGAGLPLINMHDEPYVWLDYRSSSVPKVVLLGDHGGQWGWAVIAESFPEFAQEWLKSDSVET